MKSVTRTFLLLTVFAIAMGILEGIVVVYVRQLHYPNGFDFPLTLLSPALLKVEWLREITTIVMLVSIAWLAGKNFIQRLSFFLFTFAVWDIFYYVLLKWILDWPSSLQTWDILFLIPIPWLGPVLAPVICSLTMIVMALLYVYLPEKGKPVKIRFWDWLLLLGGSGLIFYSFIKDYLDLIIQTGILSSTETPEVKEQFWKVITYYTPEHYMWLLFIFGEFFIFISLCRVIQNAFK